MLAISILALVVSAGALFTSQRAFHWTHTKVIRKFTLFFDTGSFGLMRQSEVEGRPIKWSSGDYLFNAILANYGNTPEPLLRVSLYYRIYHNEDDYGTMRSPTSAPSVIDAKDLLMATLKFSFDEMAYNLSGSKAEKNEFGVTVRYLDKEGNFADRSFPLGHLAFDKSYSDKGCVLVTYTTTQRQFVLN